MIFSMTANIKCTSEQRRPLRKSRCVSAGSDSLWLQFKSTIWVQSYSRKHTNCTNPLQERHLSFSHTITSCKKTAFVL